MVRKTSSRWDVSRIASAIFVALVVGVLMVFINSRFEDIKKNENDCKKIIQTVNQISKRLENLDARQSQSEKKIKMMQKTMFKLVLKEALAPQELDIIVEILGSNE